MLRCIRTYCYGLKKKPDRQGHIYNSDFVQTYTHESDGRSLTFISYNHDMCQTGFILSRETIYNPQTDALPIQYEYTDLPFILQTVRLSTTCLTNMARFSVVVSFRGFCNNTLNRISVRVQWPSLKGIQLLGVLLDTNLLPDVIVK